MDRKIKYFDFLFEGFTSDLIEEKGNKKKSVKKGGANGDISSNNTT